MSHGEHLLTSGQARTALRRTGLDANASEPLRPEARAALLAALDLSGNPSSVHASGRLARRTLEEARGVLARRFGADPAAVVLTSGGTEADALAVHGLAEGRRLVIGATEHDAIREAAGREASVLPVDREGVASLPALAALLEGGPPSLVCLMLANNECGTLQPVRAAAELCRRHGALLVVDAAQAAGRMRVDLRWLGAHALAVSSHKLGGPKGAGALLLAPELSGALRPLLRGGGQERGRRGGTPALPALAGFAAAVLAAVPEDAPSGGDAAVPPPLPAAARLAGLRDAIERAAVAAGAVVCGGGAARLPNTTCLALPGRRAESQVIALDLLGVEVSAGAACSSGKVTRSHVLEAMGLGPLAGEAIRVSLPWNATEADAEAFAVAYGRMVEGGRGR